MATTDQFNLRAALPAASVRIRQINAATWAMIVLACVMAGVFIICVILRLSYPTDGAFMPAGVVRSWQPDGIIVDSFPIYGSQPIQPTDKIIAVDGVPMTAIADGLFKGSPVPALALGQPRTYTVVRGGHEQVVTVQPAPYPISRLIGLTWGPVLWTLFTLAIALFLLVQKPNQQLVRALLLMGLAAWGITFYGVGLQPSDMFTPSRFWLSLLLITTGILLYMIGLLRFSLSFAPPASRVFQAMNSRRGTALSFLLPFGVIFLFLLATRLRIDSTLRWLALWIPSIAMSAAVLVALSAIFIALSYRGNADEPTRRKIRLIVFGGLFSAGIFLLLNALPILLLGRPLLDLNVLSLGAIPFTLAAAIAIFRYRLIDIDFVINRTLVYVLVTATLLAIVAGIVLVLFALFGASALGAPAITLALIIVVLLFNPLRERIQLDVDRRFYRSRYVARQRFEQFAQQTQIEVNIDKLKQELVAVIADAMQPAHVSVEECAGPPGDPLLDALASQAGALSLDALKFDSPMLSAMQAAGDVLAVPMLSRGMLVGFIQLGARRNGQDYSRDDRQLLNLLARQVASPLHTAQLARAQQLEAVERERIEQEMSVARRMQLALLPKDMPAPPGYAMQTFYQPARAVGGDFYDFIALPNDRLGIFIGDVSDKGVPAAMVMTAARTVLRSMARQHDSPGEVLWHANNMLCPDMPAGMFVTCFYVILDPASSTLCFANAGHDLPCISTASGVAEMNARGMPLGLMPDMPYDESGVMMQAGDALLLYTDGLVEAHNATGEMLGFEGLRNLLNHRCADEDVVNCLMRALSEFVGEGWMQEDDITMVTLRQIEG